MEKGLIHIYCGEGKGKTTASLGLIMRSLGAGYKVKIMQCFKGEISSEINTLKHLENVTIIRADLPKHFTWEMDKSEKNQLFVLHNEIFSKLVSLLDDKQKTLVVLDEVIGASTYGYIDKEMVLEFLKNKPDNVEVVLTGRNPLPEFVELADYVSEIHKIKHPYDKGILARKGIEY